MYISIFLKFFNKVFFFSVVGDSDVILKGENVRVLFIGVWEISYVY